MTDKLGSLLVMLLYLGLVRWVAKGALPFVITGLGLGLVALILGPYFMDDEMSK